MHFSQLLAFFTAMVTAWDSLSHNLVTNNTLYSWLLTAFSIFQVRTSEVIQDTGNSMLQFMVLIG